MIRDAWMVNVKIQLKIFIYFFSFSCSIYIWLDQFFRISFSRSRTHLTLSSIKSYKEWAKNDKKSIWICMKLKNQKSREKWKTNATHKIRFFFYLALALKYAKLPEFNSFIYYLHVVFVFGRTINNFSLIEMSAKSLFILVLKSFSNNKFNARMNNWTCKMIDQLKMNVINIVNWQNA